MTIEKVDFLKDDNSKRSHTEMYDTEKMVLRRGSTFKILLSLSGALEDLTRYSLTLTFTRGKKPSLLDGSQFEVHIGRSSPRDWEWSGKLEKNDEKEMLIAVEIPIDVPVGEYEVEVKTCDSEVNGEQVVQAGKVAILFNPWHEGT